VALWTAWFVTHLPWIAIQEEMRVGILLSVWLVAMLWAGAAGGWKVGLGAGVISSVLGLLLIGTKLAPKPNEASPDLPPAYLIVLGFLALGAGLGLVGGVVGGMFRGSGKAATSQDWLHRFGFVTVAAAAPLLFIGGLVTSTNSGMAVPDWPRTYGANMFLYPLGQAGTGIYLEHSHRLFGTLLGAATLVLMIWVLMVEPRRWVRNWAICVFGGVCLQGLLGGLRVVQNSNGMAVVHGVLAQVVLSALVALAVLLWTTPERAALSVPFANPRKARAFATAALHTTLLQLLLGALYRHLRAPHALWAHIGFAFVVLFAGALGGFAAASVPRDAGPLAKALRRCGGLMVGVVILQFLLGWASLGMGGTAREAPNLAAALIRTAHQANGALLLGLTTAAAVLAKVLYRNVVPAKAPEMAR
jgi:cytochrome c oxidase assembly protein subunit 15